MAVEAIRALFDSWSMGNTKDDTMTPQRACRYFLGGFSGYGSASAEFASKKIEKIFGFRYINVKIFV